MQWQTCFQGSIISSDRCVLRFALSLLIGYDDGLICQSGKVNISIGHVKNKGNIFDCQTVFVQEPFSRRTYLHVMHDILNQ
jgi:hypothetical protein